MKTYNEIFESDQYKRLNIAYKPIDRLIMRINHEEKSRRRDKSLKHYISLFPDIKSISLTKQEKKEIHKVWDRLGLRYNIKWFLIYKYLNGYFSPYFIPDDIWRHAEVALNNHLHINAIQHKVLAYKILPDGVFPTPIGAIVNQSALNESFEKCSFDDLYNQLQQFDKVVMKRAIGSGGGKGVTLITWDELSAADKESFRQGLSKLSQDYIFQEFLEIHDDFKTFNPASVNCVRLITISLNGNVSLASSFLRMSSGNQFNDNASDGGVYVSVHPDGSLHDYGILDGFVQQKAEMPTGIPFKGYKITQYKDMVSQLIKWHENMPYVGYVAWDATLDAEGNVRLMEINLDSQEIIDHQAFNGPLFGSRTEELIQYVVNNPPKRNYSF